MDSMTHIRTEEPPHEPGYYWHEDDEKTMVKVRRERGALRVSSSGVKVDHIGGLWTGPMPTPSEAAEQANTTLHVQTKRRPTPGPYRTPDRHDPSCLQGSSIITDVKGRDEPIFLGSANEALNDSTDIPGHYLANAQLMAASWGMREALRSLVVASTGALQALDDRGISDTLTREVQKAKTALRSAAYDRD